MDYFCTIYLHRIWQLSSNTTSFIVYLGYMFRPLWGHHQAFHLSHVIKTLHTSLGSHVLFTRYWCVATSPISPVDCRVVCWIPLLPLIYITIFAVFLLIGDVSTHQYRYTSVYYACLHDTIKQQSQLPHRYLVKEI